MLVEKSSDIFRLQNSTIHGNGIFATKIIETGEVICILKGTVVIDAHIIDGVPCQWPNTIGVAPEVWISPELPLSDMNHSCDPNAYFNDNFELIASKPIAIGDEITFDYSTTECDPNWSMDCSCKSRNCRKTLLPIQDAFDDAPKATRLMLDVWLRAHKRLKVTA